LNIALHPIYFCVLYYDMFDFTDYETEGHILGVMSREFLPHLNWMRLLKSLVILKPCDDHEEGDICVVQLLEWLFCKGEYENCLPVLLERFWYEDHSRTSSRYNPLLTENDLTCPSVKSLVLNSALPARNDVSTLSQNQFHNLEHIGNTKFRRFDHLPNLKYIRGRTFPINKVGFASLFTLPRISNFLKFILLF